MLRGLGAEVEPLDRLRWLLGRVDLAVAAAGADGYLIDMSMAQEAGGGRQGRPLVVVDLAVPPDVEPAVGTVSGVDLIGLDEIREDFDRHISSRREELGTAEAVIDDVLARHGVGTPTRRELDRLTRSLVNKVLHEPMVRLGAAAQEDGDWSALLDAASELFGLAEATGRRLPPPTE